MPGPAGVTPGSTSAAAMRLGFYIGILLGLITALIRSGIWQRGWAE